MMIVIILGLIMLNVNILSVVTLSVIMLSVILLHVILANAMAPTSSKDELKLVNFKPESLKTLTEPSPSVSFLNQQTPNKILIGKKFHIAILSLPEPAGFKP
jgi:hypothetical protein